MNNATDNRSAGRKPDKSPSRAAVVGLIAGDLRGQTLRGGSHHFFVGERPMKHARADYDRIQDPSGIIPADEPVFLIRGQDKLGAAVVSLYADLAEHHGASPELVKACREQVERMEAWPKHKMPDL